MYEGIQKQTYDAGYPIYPHFGRGGGRNFVKGRLEPVPHGLCHVMHYHSDKNYPCQGGIGLRHSRARGELIHGCTDNVDFWQLPSSDTTTAQSKRGLLATEGQQVTVL